MEVGKGIEFVSGNGGTVVLSSKRTEMDSCGIENGFVFFEDTHINSKNKLYIDMESGNTETVLEHDSGETIIKFGLTSAVPSGISDFKFEGLQDNTWYRLKFNGELGETRSGTAHGKTSSKGELLFRNVIVPNE